MDPMQCSESFGITVITGGEKDIPLHRIQSPDFEIRGSHNATAVAALAAGCNFDGSIDSIEFLDSEGPNGEEEIKHIHKITRDELTLMTSIFRRNKDGKEYPDYSDPDLDNIATATPFYFHIYFAQDWRLYKKPIMRIKLRPITDEDPDITDYAMNLRVVQNRGPIEGNDAWERRFGNAVDTEQKFAPPNSFVTEEIKMVFLVGDPDLNYLHVKGSDGQIETKIDNDEEAALAQAAYVRRFWVINATPTYLATRDAQALFFPDLMLQPGSDAMVELSLEGTLRAPVIDFIGKQSKVIGPSKSKASTVGDMVRGTAPVVHVNMAIEKPAAAPAEAANANLVPQNLKVVLPQNNFSQTVQRSRL